MAGMVTQCCGCGEAVPVSAGRAIVLASTIVVRCRACLFPRAAEPTATATPIIAPPRIGSIVAVALGLALFSVRTPVPAIALLAAIDLGQDDAERDPSPAFAVSAAPAEPPPVAALSRTFEADAEVDITWYHPLAAPRRLPGKSDREFGAARHGTRPSECGGGHCGVDLGHAVGEVVHAALPGVVTRIERHNNLRGGRYVRLEHAGGYATYYFHLDRIHPDLVEGIEVAAGEPIGTMGHTGILRSAPHLHFAVSRTSPDGTERYVDPEPMLRRAVLLDEAAPFPDRQPGEPGDEETLAPAGADDQATPSLGD